jgi:hypothetical protein
LRAALSGQIRLAAVPNRAIAHGLDCVLGALQVDPDQVRHGPSGFGRSDWTQCQDGRARYHNRGGYAFEFDAHRDQTLHSITPSTDEIRGMCQSLTGAEQLLE